MGLAGLILQISVHNYKFSKTICSIGFFNIKCFSLHIEFIVKWEKPLYEIRESDGQLEVALITDSVLQNSIAVATRPTAINSNLPEERLSFVPGSNNQRVTINTTGLDITGLDLTGEFGKAQIVGFEGKFDIY